MKRVLPKHKPKIARVKLEQGPRNKANRKKLKEENVRKLPVRKSQYRVWDAGTDAARGLCVLVSPAGAKTYMSTYYFPGSVKTHSRSLGRVGEMMLQEARDQCRLDRRAAKRGIDPKADDPTKSSTWAEAVDQFVRSEQEGRKKNSPSTVKEARRVLLKLSNPTHRGFSDEEKERHKHPWLTRPIATIRREEIEELLELVRDGDKSQGLKPRPYLANSLYGRLCTFFAWCAKRDKVKVSPMLSIDKPWEGAERRSRVWFSGSAADDAIKALWRAADTMGGTEGKYLKLLLLVGKRKTALAEMKWEHIDDTWFWTPPKPTGENKRLHPIPLSVYAQRLLHPRKAKGFVFPGDDDGHIYVNGSWLQNMIIKASGLEDYFHHGVRHLVETKMAALRTEKKKPDDRTRPLILPHIRDMLLDHRPKRGSGADYDHHDYIDDMRDAMELWAAYVAKLVRPEGVAVIK